MSNHFRIAFAALAIGGVALPPASVAQETEAVDAAEALAQSEPGPDADEALGQSDAQAEPADASVKPNAGAFSAEPTWDAVIQLVQEELAPELLAETREAADAAEALGSADPGAAVAEAPASADDEPFVTEPVSEAAIQVTNWVIASGDNAGLPFIVIDKNTAALLVFGPDGAMLGESPALLGVSSGDESAPDIGERALSAISREERTTPAGRFAAQYGFASGDRRVFWVDYATSVALHPVVTANRSERRLQRLRSPSGDDNRITFGCINVPASFYADIIQPTFEQAGGIVYILPDTRPLEEVFPAVQRQASAMDRAPFSQAALARPQADATLSPAENPDK